MVRRNLFVCVALTVELGPFLLSQSGVKRPPMTGVAHVDLKTNDLAAGRRFYGMTPVSPTPLPCPSILVLPLGSTSTTTGISKSTNPTAAAALKDAVRDQRTSPTKDSRMLQLHRGESGGYRAGE